MSDGLPALYPLRLRQGSRWSRVITPKDDTGAPFYDLTGYTARAHVRRNIADATPLLEATTGNGKITLGGTAGTITITFTATELAALAPGPAEWDLELIPASGEAAAFALLAGPVEIEGQVTK